MPDFDKVLAKLQADDLKLLLPRTGVEAPSRRAPIVADPVDPPTASVHTPKRRRRNKKTEAPAAGAELTPLAEAPPAPAPMTNAPSPEIQPSITTTAPTEESATDVTPDNTDPLAGLSTQEHPLPTFDPKPSGKKRTRQTVAHDWPAVGTKLSATYFGQTYTAEIVPARKKLKSGKQVRLLDGPSKGRFCDSLSEAMLLATARQRREQKLARKGVSSGWTFWLASPVPSIDAASASS